MYPPLSLFPNHKSRLKKKREKVNISEVFDRYVTIFHSVEILLKCTCLSSTEGHLAEKDRLAEPELQPVPSDM